MEIKASLVFLVTSRNRKKRSCLIFDNNAVDGGVLCT